MARATHGPALTQPRQDWQQRLLGGCQQSLLCVRLDHFDLFDHFGSASSLLFPLLLFLLSSFQYTSAAVRREVPFFSFRLSLSLVFSRVFFFFFCSRCFLLSPSLHPFISFDLAPIRYPLSRRLRLQSSLLPSTKHLPATTINSTCRMSTRL